jgi:hypothetical protein
MWASAKRAKATENGPARSLLGGFGMELRGRAAAVAAVIAIAGALSACAAPGGSATSTTAAAPSSIAPDFTQTADLKKLAGLKPAEVLSMLGKPDLKRAEPPAELWQYRATDCVLNLFFYDEAGGYRLTHIEAWQRSLASGGTAPARCHDEDAPIKAHLISQSRL